MVHVSTGIQVKNKTPVTNAPAWPFLRVLTAISFHLSEDLFQMD